MKVTTIRRTYPVGTVSDAQVRKSYPPASAHQSKPSLVVDVLVTAAAAGICLIIAAMVVTALGLVMGGI